MSLKLKARGLGIVAAMAFGAVAVMNASANGAGHFVTTGNAHVHVLAFASPNTPHGLTSSITAWKANSAAPPSPTQAQLLPRQRPASRLPRLMPSAPQHRVKESCLSQ
jgi:hypothetical protein